MTLWCVLSPSLSSLIHPRPLLCAPSNAVYPPALSLAEDEAGTCVCLNWTLCHVMSSSVLCLDYKVIIGR